MISARSAPASRSASRMTTKSAGLAPTPLIASTTSDSSTPGSKTNARAGSSSMMISVSSVTTSLIRRHDSALRVLCNICSWRHLLVFIDPHRQRTMGDNRCVTFTSPPMTMVPVRELTMTLAAGRAGSTLIFSSRLTKDTYFVLPGQRARAL